MTMNPEVKAKWLQALRSGEYQQGQLNLRRKTKDAVQFCCLGVLCDVSQQGKWSHRSYRVGEESLCSTLPPSIRKWAGINTELTDKDNWPHDDSAEACLIQMNDNGKSFVEIADWIERNL